MTKAINTEWINAEIRWANWNGEEFQCIHESAARELLAEIERLREARALLLTVAARLRNPILGGLSDSQKLAIEEWFQLERK